MDMKGFASLKLDNYLQTKLDLIGSDYKKPIKVLKNLCRTGQKQ